MNQFDFDEDQIEFTYQSVDGEIKLKCDHFRDTDKLLDWNVWCGKGTKLFKKYKAHLNIQKIRNSVLDLTEYTLMFEVVDRNKSLDKAFYSSVQTISLQGKAPLRYLKLHQRIENDYSELILNWPTKLGL